MIQFFKNLIRRLFSNSKSEAVKKPKRKAIKIYLASPLNEDRREALFKAVKMLRNKGYEVYNPLEHKVVHEWDLPNTEWGFAVFIHDTDAILDSDFVVCLNYGREFTTGGTVLEQGMAFMAGEKFGNPKVILVEMTDNVQSLMVANARYATVKGLEGLEKYDFKNPKPLRVDTKQKQLWKI